MSSLPAPHKPHPVLHPFMVGSLFVLVHFLQMRSHARWEELAWVWALVLGVIYATYWVWKRLVKMPYKAALLVTLALLVICFYVDLKVELMRRGWVTLAKTRHLLPLVVLGCLWVGWKIVRTRRNLYRMKVYLNVATTLMVVFTLFQVAFYRPDKLPPLEAAVDPPVTAVTAAAPDIYFILADSYTGMESLQKHWGYDSSAFRDFLVGHHFQVLANARGNYSSTPYCLASALDMDYPPTMPPSASDFARQDRLTNIIDHAAAPRQLRRAGYEVVNLGEFNVAGTTAYYQVPLFVYGSLVELLHQKSIFGNKGLRWFERNDWRRVGDINLRILEELKQLPARSRSRPRFVYAHLMMPHFPYYFDREGRRRESNMAEHQDKSAYFEQLLFVNHSLTNVVAALLEKSAVPPVILIQGDHGFRYLPGAEGGEEAHSILNTVLLPGAKGAEPYPGMTPVNSFRMILNRYCGTKYEYVPDLQKTSGAKVE